jgi:hypothetical protein
MAKITHGPTVSDTRGKAGDVQFQKSRGGSYIRAARLTAPMSGLPDQVFRIPPAGGTPAFGAVDLTKSAAVSGPLPVSFGGTGTATPSLVAGDNITITGSWPNNTIALKSPITGPFIVGDGAGEQNIFLNGGAGHDRVIRFQSGGSTRWSLVVGYTEEGGSNAGSDFGIYRYSDAGAYLGFPLYIRRSDGQVGIGSIEPGKALDVSGDIRASLQLISTVATGTAPLAVTSTTEVANLRAATATDLAAGSILTVAKGGTGRDAGSIPVYANNAAAIAGGLAVGDFYRTGADPDPVCVVH